MFYVEHLTKPTERSSAQLPAPARTFSPPTLGSLIAAGTHDHVGIPGPGATRGVIKASRRAGAACTQSRLWRPGDAAISIERMFHVKPMDRLRPPAPCRTICADTAHSLNLCAPLPRHAWVSHRCFTWNIPALGARELLRAPPATGIGCARASAPVAEMLRLRGNRQTGSGVGGAILRTNTSRRHMALRRRRAQCRDRWPRVVASAHA